MTSQTRPAASPPEREWATYLDALAAAVQLLVDRQEDEGDVALAAFPTIAQPASSCPDCLERRRREVARLVERATADLERRQTAVGHELASLRPRRPRSAYRADTLGAVDVLG